MQRLTIESIGARGDGIARLNDGQPVYVEGGLIGETVEAVLTKGKDGVARAQIRSVIKRSPDRQTPSCSHYDRCGGCSVQHMTSDAYWTWKINKTKALIAAKNIARLGWDDPVFINEGTRRRVTFKVVRQGKRIIVGYNQRRSHSVVDAPSHNN